MEEFTPEFQFVNVSKPGRTLGTMTEHVVRSHAMRQVHRQQRAKLRQQSTTQKQPGSKGKSSILSKQQVSKSILNLVDAEDIPIDSKLLGCCDKKDGLGHEVDKSSSSKQDFSRGYNTFFGQFPQNAVLNVDEKLLSHLSNVLEPISNGISQRFLLWANGVKIFMGIGCSYEFVRHAMLAWSASQMSLIAGKKEMSHKALHHRAVALRGLQEAVANFSGENADAILAASVMLSWQAPDSGSWAVLRRGASAVTEKIIARGYDSRLVDFDRDQPSIPASVAPSRLNLDKESNLDLDDLLHAAIVSLNKIEAFFPVSPELCGAINDLHSIVESYQGTYFLGRAEVNLVMQKLQGKLFCIPLRFISQIHTDPAAMLVMAHLHALALLVEPAGDPVHAHRQSLNAGPIESFHDEIKAKVNACDEGMEKDIFLRILYLLRFPLQVVAFSMRRLNGMLDEDSGVLMTSLKRVEFSLYSTDDDHDDISSDVPAPWAHEISMLKVLKNFPMGLWQNSYGWI